MTVHKNKIFASFLLSFLIIPGVLAFTPVTHASFGSDVLNAIGCDDKNKNGTVELSECGSTNNGVATSFTDFKGDLTPPNPKGYASGLTQAQDARTFALNVTNFALGFLGLIAVLIIIYGGFLMVTSIGGDGFGKGKKALTYSVIGLLIVMSSFAIVNTVLLAPSGSEKGTSSTTGLSSNTIRGVAANARFNYLSDQINTDFLKIYNSYVFYLQMKQELDASINTINAFNPSASCLKATSCGAQLDNVVNTELVRLNNFINSNSGNTIFRTNLADLIQSVTAVKMTEVSKLNASSCSSGLFDGLSCLASFKLDPFLLQAKGSVDAIVAAFNGDSSHPSTYQYKFLQDAYAQDLNEAKLDIGNVYQTVKAISSTLALASSYFNDLVPGAPYADVATAAASRGAIQDEIENTSAYLAPNKDLTSIDQTSIKKVTSDLIQIKSILDNLQFVNSVLTVDGVKGNAPYVVNFSTVGSSDPSGLAVQSSNIFWDFHGDGGFKDSSFNNDQMSCTSQQVTANCIFRKPGTYRVRVKVNPSVADDKVTGVSYAEEIAPGISYVDILVNPPSTKINLKANSQPIVEYDKDGNMIEDHNKVYFTLSEAQAGIKFDASESEYDAGNKVVNDPSAKIRWDFGIPSSNNDTIQLASLKNLQPVQVYNTVGNYQVTFEVTDKNGVADRKIFTVVVSNLAPRITNPLQKAKVGETVTFDGSNSTTDGTPLLFNWKIEKLDTTTTAYLQNRLSAWFTPAINSAHAADLAPGSSLDLSPAATTTAAAALKKISPVTLQPSKRSDENAFYNCKMPDNKDDTLECSFKKAGLYRITLSLVDTDGGTHEEITQISISSNAPTAAVRTNTLSETAPAVYELDGSTLSYDPDEQDTSNLEYSWEVNPPTCTVVGYATQSSSAELLANATSNISSQTSCEKLKDFNPAGAQPVIKFKQKGAYTISLVVRSIDEPTSVSNSAEQLINVENVLDVSWGAMKSSAVLTVPGAVGSSNPDQVPTNINTQPVAPITFLFSSSQAVSYELNYGDGQSDTGEMTPGQVKSVVHNYDKVGKFLAKLSVFDADDIENKLTRNIFIGDGDTPVSIVTTRVNDSEVQPGDVDLGNQILHNTIVVNRKDNLVFDAGNSLNTDGTGRRLIYSWNINNGDKQSTNKSLAYKFTQVSENGQPYVVKLKTSDERDPSKYGEDSVNILVIGAAPTLRSLTAVPDGNTLTTPVTIKLNAVGAADEDGQVVSYKWWYYDASAPATPDNRLGLQITTTPSASITIGTRGLENEKPRYKFGVEITDNDNITVSTDATDENYRLQITAPEVQVTNGPNKAPVAKFNVDRTSVQLGEAVNFTSASFDPDQGGGIKEYKWDFGDGTKADNLSSVSHTYQKASVDGYKAKLTVVDNNSSEATSDSIRIYVDAVAQPPLPAFTTTQTAGGKTVQFTNSSKADIDAGATISKYNWDFDVTVDSNGDGKKDNDSDSSDVNPVHTYADYGIFRAKLTVEDNQGQSQSITNFVNVRPPQAPQSTTSTTTNNNNSSGSNSSSSSSASKTVGANLFNASNSVDPGLLIASIAAYAILLLISRRVKKQN